MKRTASLLVVATAIACIGGWTGAAHASAEDAAAQPRARASASNDEDALIRRGLELRRRGDDAAALPHFERAYWLAQSPRSAAQLGFAEQALGRWSDAEVHVAEALRAGDDPWVRKN